MAEEIGTELVHLGHLDLTGTPAMDPDPAEQIPWAQVDVTTCDNCRVATKAVAV